MVAHPPDEPLGRFNWPQGAVRVSRKGPKAHLPKQADRFPVAQRTEGHREVARFADGAPRQRNGRAPHKEVLGRALAKPA
eukprot:6991132-Alexandrium_andersonii.AAC.1